MPHPFKGTVTIFACFFGGNTLKTEHFLKHVYKYGKTILNNNFIENLNISVKHGNEFG